MKNGLREGDGKYTWKNGAYYTGEWESNQPHGDGTYIFPKGGKALKLTGKFSNGLPDGECRYYLDKDTVFKTDWVNGNCVKIYE